MENGFLGFDIKTYCREIRENALFPVCLWTRYPYRFEEIDEGIEADIPSSKDYCSYKIFGTNATKETSIPADYIAFTRCYHKNYISDVLVDWLDLDPLPNQNLVYIGVMSNTDGHPIVWSWFQIVDSYEANDLIFGTSFIKATKKAYKKARIEPPIWS